MGTMCRLKNCETALVIVNTYEVILKTFLLFIVRIYSIECHTSCKTMFLDQIKLLIELNNYFVGL